MLRTVRWQPVKCIHAVDIYGLSEVMGPGVATAAEIGPDTFEQRLRAQAAAHDAVLLNPLVVGASARTPLVPPRSGQG